MRGGSEECVCLFTLRRHASLTSLGARGALSPASARLHFRLWITLFFFFVVVFTARSDGGVCAVIRSSGRVRALVAKGGRPTDVVCYELSTAALFVVCSQAVGGVEV